jgi:hypothetical protein
MITISIEKNYTKCGKKMFMCFKVQCEFETFDDIMPVGKYKNVEISDGLASLL